MINKIVLVVVLMMVFLGVVFVMLQDDFCNVVEYNCLVLVQKYIVQGVDLNLNMCDGMLFLVDVFKDKNIEVVEVFICVKNIDFECINVVGENVLMMVVYQGLLFMVKLLVEMYDVEVNKIGWIVLYYVVINGYDDIVKYLFDYVVYIDVESFNVIMLLMMVVMGGYIIIVKLLFDEGVDMNLCNQQKMDVIDFVKWYYQDEIVVGLELCWCKLVVQVGQLVLVVVFQFVKVSVFDILMLMLMFVLK